MELLAVNKHVAVFDNGEDNHELDAFAALRDLITMKNCRQLLQFLKKHGCHRSFCVDSDNLYTNSIKHSGSDRFNGKRFAEGAFTLAESLDSAIEKDIEIEPLDELIADDLENEKVYQLSIDDLMVFKRDITSFLVLAAIANGAPIPDGLFAKLDPVRMFGDDWCAGSLPCSVKDLVSYGIPITKTGAEKNYFFGDVFFESTRGIFNHLSKFSNYQLQTNDSGVPIPVGDVSDVGEYSNRYPLSIDGVIYSLEEYYESEESDKCEYFITVTTYPDFDHSKAIRLLCGRIVSELMNTSFFSPYDGYDFEIEHVDEDSYEHYSFKLNEGFTLVPAKPFDFWVELLFDQTIKLVIENKVTLCPVCGTPVLIRDYRGKKAREVCSDSCKSIATRKRREKATALAASNVPIEKAISIIGAEYAGSIRKWYSEYQDLQSSQTTFVEGSDNVDCK